MNKSMHYLYGHILVICNEETCINYLQERNLHPELGSCYKLKDGVICGDTLKEYQKNNRKRDSNGDLLKTIYLRCQKKVVKLITL
jgi:hypothetical protein